MRAALIKEFKFEAAHQLPNHDGACRRLHGHSYRVTLHVEGQVRPADGAHDEGMVIDFSRLKRIWQAQLEPRLDHQMLNDTLSAVYQPTTAENIARFIYDTFTRAIASSEASQGVLVTGVTVWETATGAARFPA